MIKLLDLNKQHREIGGEIDAALQRVIRNSAYVGGRYVSSFEQDFAAYVGSKHCIAVGNGTDALEIVFAALEISGKRVIVPAMTAVPTVEAIVRTGNIPVFCDVDCHYTLCMLTVSRLLKKDSVILPVHLYGAPVHMSHLLERAQELTVIEDCAQAHGTEHAGRHVGTFGKAGTFSFYPGKNLGAFGDAGAIVTDDDELAEKCRMISNHGRLSKFDHVLVGRNSRMDGLQAEVLSVKLRHLKKWNEIRRRNAAVYFETLPEDILPCWERTGDVYNYHQFPIRVPNRKAVRERLSSMDIETGMHYPFSLPGLPPYHKYSDRTGYPCSETLAKEEVSIPVHEMLTRREVEYVAKSVVEVLREQG